MKDYQQLKDLVLDKLKTELPSHLTYHNLDHTLDVLEVCNQYIRRLAIPAEEAYLIRLGAVVHDMGFLETAKNHEEVGSKMAGELMTARGMSESEIKIIQGLVMATKIPQNPKNELEKIICDADLDYLGRDDYFAISHKLYLELIATETIQTKEDWKNLQVRFLQNHVYHTTFAKENREPKKQYWLSKILKGNLE